MARWPPVLLGERRISQECADCFAELGGVGVVAALRLWEGLPVGRVAYDHCLRNQGLLRPIRIHLEELSTATRKRNLLAVGRPHRPPEPSSRQPRRAASIAVHYPDPVQLACEGDLLAVGR